MAPLPVTQPVADLCDAHGARVRVLPAAFRFFTGVTRFAGPLRLIALHAADRALAESLKRPCPGAVAVVSVAAAGVAVFGDGMARDAEANGWAGVVIDGAVRDVALIRPRSIGVAATAVAPRIERDGPAVGEVAAMSAFGVMLHAGDWIVADEDGVIALDAALAASVAGQ
jgi:regulator of ribonuclease activity A